MMKKLTTLLFICLIAVSGCKKNAEEATPADGISANTDLSILKGLGFSKNIIDKGDYYAIDGDIKVTKASLAIAKTKSAVTINKGALSQAHTYNTVFYTAINVYIDGSIPTTGEDEWVTELQQALANWNSIRNFRILFTLVTDPALADITVKSDNGSLPDNVIAQATFPVYANSAPGNQIIINLDFLSNMTVSSGQKVYNLCHEIGHCISFRHTNWDLIGEGTSTVGAVTIAGTLDNDAASIMNGGTALNSWNGFSARDLVAVRTVYPYDTWEVPFYRYVKTDKAQHYYTVNWGELGYGANGYIYEGITGYIYTYQESTTIPLYKFTVPTDNFYTTSSAAINGYTAGGVVGYIYPTQVTNSIPIYRYFNTTVGHFYTWNYSELGAGGNGWTYEGILGYVMAIY